MSIIEAQHINHLYGSLAVLDDISLQIKEGEFVSIIGPSGCGKSTLLKILGGLIPFSGGSIIAKGNSIDTAVKQHDFSFVFQKPTLLPWLNVKQNIDLPLSISGRDIKEIKFNELWKNIESEKLFDGWDGLSEAMEDILASLNKGDEYVAFMMGEIAETNSKLHDFFVNFHKKRSDKGIKLRSITPTKISDIIKKEKESQYLTLEFKTISENYPRGVNIYADKIIFISFDTEPHVKIIKSLKLAEAYRALFERAWEIENLPEKLLELVNLRGFEHYYPKELSGGMQSRVAISRALITNPDILFMDEPFGAVDELTRENLHLELLKIWQQTHKTIIFITHSISEAVFLSNRVIVLSERPAKIIGIKEINLPYPRNEETKQSKEYFKNIEWLHKQLKNS